MVRELSIHQEHELLNKLEDAGLGKDLAQAIINSRDNALAKSIINFAMEKSGIKLIPKPIHPDYKPIRKGIVIEQQEHNRQEILNNSSKYVLGDNFKDKILAKCANGKTGTETLRGDELLKSKKDKEITKEMKISEIAPDQITERIIQLGKIDRWVIIGYCKGLVVDAGPYSGGRVRVGARELDVWDGGCCLLSRDIEI